MEHQFTPADIELRAILDEFGITAEITGREDLLRYNYKKYDPDSEEIRLILRADLNGRTPVVIKFINEYEYPTRLIEEQAAFSEHLRECGVPTARRYMCGGVRCVERVIDDARVDVTVEDFETGEIKLIDRDNIVKIGALLAHTHDIAERDDCHADGPVLFDILKENDLMGYDRFSEQMKKLTGAALERAQQIERLYLERMARLEPLRARPTYATQGDISDCNLFVNAAGEIGMFDFNNCGENRLFVDAIMQGVFEARLMDYAEPIAFDESRELFRAFMRGYTAVRPLSDEDRVLLPDMWAVINGMWLGDIAFMDDSLAKSMERGDMDAVMKRLDWAYERLCEQIEL